MVKQNSCFFIKGRFKINGSILELDYNDYSFSSALYQVMYI